MSRGSAGERPWWVSAVIYQIYPRSFCDASGDGVGDLEGVIRHLDHLSWLGVDALWLSPFYPSPMADFGYDVSDYCEVDPVFGTLETFDVLIAEAHSRDLKVIVDWVPNHTSDQHPWFVSSKSSREDPKRGWYWWRDDRSDGDGGSGPPGSPGRMPNNWRSAFPGVGLTEFPPAWTWDADTKQWYLHLFLTEQPDLNWSNPDVRSAMVDVLAFWLKRGVDGFRVDVIHALGKDPAFPDLPEDLAPIPMCALIDEPSTHALIAGLRSDMDRWQEPPRVLIGETVLPSVAQIARYYGTPDSPELDLAFNFHPLRTPWDAKRWRVRIDEVEKQMTAAGAWPSWVLSNHDNSRHATRYGSEARSRVAAMMLLTLRGTPFLYAGEEIGQRDAVVPPDRQLDPGGRDGCRAPLPWDAAPGHGWAGEPWLPWPPGAESGATAAEERADELSILNLYRNLMVARSGSISLQHGSFSWLESGDGLLAYRRGAEDDCRVVVLNFTPERLPFRPPTGTWRIQLTTSPAGRDPSVQGRGDIEVGPDEGLLLAPA